MRKLTVKSNNLFKGYKIGGLAFGQYLSLKTHEKLAAQINFIENVVTKISQIKYDQGLGWPANLWGLSLQIDGRIKQIDIIADPANACMLTLEIGELIEKINNLPLTKQAILNFKQMVTQEESLEHTHQTRVNGADIANKKIGAKKDVKMLLVLKKWHTLGEEGKPERNRVSNIVNHLKDESGVPIKISRNAVTGYLTEAGLWTKQIKNKSN